MCVCGYVMKYNIKMKSKCYGFKKIIINVKYKKKENGKKIDRERKKIKIKTGKKNENIKN